MMHPELADERFYEWFGDALKLTDEHWPGSFVHPMAVVSKDCTIGEGTKIWSGALVRNGTKLGKGVSVGIGCALEGCEIGDGTHLNPHVLAGNNIIIGKRCFIAGNVVLCNDAWPSVDRDAFGGWHPKPNDVLCRIGDDTAICTGAIILPGVTIGSNCLVGAGVVMRDNLPDGYAATSSTRFVKIDPSRIHRVRPC